MKKLSLAPLLLASSAALALIAACGGSGNNGLNQPDNSQDTGTTDTGSQDVTINDTTDNPDTTTTPDGSGDTSTDPGDGSTTPPDTGGETVDRTYIACVDDSECTGGRPCVLGVCIQPPQAVATGVEEIDTPEEDGTISTELRPSGAPLDFSCYSDGSLTAAPAGPATATLNGVVERFGSGPGTEGLCVSVYNEEALLPWLKDSECFGIQSDEDAFVACFQLDACRCDSFYADDDDGEIELMIDAANDALSAAGSDLEIDDLNSCYTFIGNCIAIEDAAARSACEARVQERSGVSTATSLLFGHTISTENTDGTEFASFSIPDMPTNQRFAFKTSGREIRWRDAWEYGLYSRADLVINGAIEINTNAVSASTWQTIPPAVGFTRGIADTNGAVAGAIRDCGVQGVRRPLNVQHATAGFAFLTETTRLAYFNGNPNNQLPEQALVDANTDSLFAAINLPPGPNRVATMACTANCVPGDGIPVYVSIGARNVFQTPKSVIIATFEGLIAP